MVGLILCCFPTENESRMTNKFWKFEHVMLFNEDVWIWNEKLYAVAST